jgi:hypothetical protein
MDEEESLGTAGSVLVPTMSDPIVDIQMVEAPIVPALPDDKPPTGPSLAPLSMTLVPATPQGSQEAQPDSARTQSEEPGLTVPSRGQTLVIITTRLGQSDRPNTRSQAHSKTPL